MNGRIASASIAASEARACSIRLRVAKEFDFRPWIKRPFVGLKAAIQESRALLCTAHVSKLQRMVAHVVVLRMCEDAGGAQVFCAC
jgi:hypothetical protein